MAIAEQRLERVRRRAKVEAILFWSLENIRYLCGFSGSDGVLIIAGHERTFLSDSRYEEQARGEVREATFKKYQQKIEGIVQFLQGLRVKRVGFESAAMPYESYQKLREKLDRVSFVPLSREIAGLRARKNGEELEKIRRAIRVLQTLPRDSSPESRSGRRRSFWSAGCGAGGAINPPSIPSWPRARGGHFPTGRPRKNGWSERKWWWWILACGFRAITRMKRRP
jgi:hypothetical protein